MRFATLKAYLLAGLAGGPWANVLVTAGPEDPSDYPGRCVVLSSVGGSGLNTEDLFDGVGWQIMAVGEQNTYDDAEGLAFALDARMINTFSQSIGGLWVTKINRQGSAPTVLTVDDAERHRFTCSYIVDARSTVV